MHLGFRGYLDVQHEFVYAASLRDQSLDAMTEAGENLKETIQAWDTDPSEFVDTTRINDRSNKATKRFRESKASFEKYAREAKAKLAVMDEAYEDFLIYLIFGGLIFFLGLALQAGGFRRWERKQKKEDQLLELKIRALQREFGLEEDSNKDEHKPSD